MTPRFEDLIERHHDEIFAYLWRLLGKERQSDVALEVEDITQEVFMRAYESYLSLRPTAITGHGFTRSRPIALIRNCDNRKTDVKSISASSFPRRKLRARDLTKTRKDGSARSSTRCR